MLECPFCGAKRCKHIYINQGDHLEYAIACENCGAVGPNSLTILSAMDAWNMRRKEMPAPYTSKLQSK